MQTLIVILCLTPAAFVLVYAARWAWDVRWRLIEYDMTRQRYADFRKEWEDLRREFRKINEEKSEAQKRAEAWQLQYRWAVEELKAQKEGRN